MKTFEDHRAKLIGFYEAVKEIRARPTPTENPCATGHQFDHDVIVASHAISIAPTVRVAMLAFCASLLHSFDYSVGRENCRSMMEQATGNIPSSLITDLERTEIIDAAMRHRELNQDDQSITQQVLMDADRLANMMLVMFINLAKCCPKLPPIEFEYLSEVNPVTTYKVPRSNIDNMRTHFAYMEMFRMPKAKLLAETYEKNMRQFIGMVGDEIRAIGLENVRV